MARKSLLALMLLLALAGCAGAKLPAANPTAALPAESDAALPTLAFTLTSPPSVTLAPSATIAASRTPLPSLTPTPQGLGPDSYPPGVNPLTGLPVSNPDLLALPPALISVSNFPVTARPQSGLSNAAFVYEVYTGYGMTRYAAIYYGDLPQVNGKPLEVGPIRSGRLPYEPLRALLGGFMLFASGDESVLRELNNYTNVWGPVNDVNGVFVTGDLIQKTAAAYAAGLGKPQLSGLSFSAEPPAGGVAGRLLWIPYTSPNQVFWRYDPASGAYNRTQDNYDGLTFTKMTDRQTGQPLAFQNVIVLFAYHNALLPEKIEIGLGGVTKMPALLFRDGKMYEISWSSVDAAYYNQTGHMRMMRFFDANGSPIPLKPGRTWVQVVSAGSPYFESVDSTRYTDLIKKSPGSGAWSVLFVQPVPQKNN